MAVENVVVSAVGAASGALVAPYFIESKGVAVRAAALAAAAGSLALIVAPHGLGAGDAVWTALLFALLGALALVDWETETVPDALTLALVAFGIGHAAVTGLPIASFAAPAAVILAAGYVQERITKEKGMFGSGDFFLVAGIAAWFGPVHSWDVVLLASVGVALTCILARRRRVALAPSLGAAAVFVWLGGPIL